MRLRAAIASIGVVACVLPAAPPAHRVAPAVAKLDLATEASVVAPDRWSAIDAAVAEALEQMKMPGCAMIVGRHDEILLRRAWGSRSILPEKTPMTIDTVFDLASLTKAVATGASIMKLVDRKVIDLDAPASRYVPELAPLAPFTVRQLLLHESGLPAVTQQSDYGPDSAADMRGIAKRTLKTAPGERFLYSDTGYVVLGEIVKRKGGADLATFARREIYEPLGMNDTMFLPNEALRARTAPTEQREGAWMKGVVHDPRSYGMGGVAGHAGLFSTADDLARFAQAMLAHRIVSEKTTTLWTQKSDHGRALGWDVDSSFASHRSPLLSPRAYGHGGFTGTALWIDPVRDLFVLFLSNRVHPDGKGAVNPLIAQVAGLAIEGADTRPGIDVLARSGFSSLRNARVGLLTNQSARSKDGRTTIDILRKAPGVTLAAIYTPEHGLGAKSEGKIGDATYEGIPVFSLYGNRSAPGSQADVDTVVFDLQDAGVRFYTYASTMKSALSAAADQKKRFVVLDRPNPLGGDRIEGPLLPRASSFVNYHSLPIVHGMTMGELARMFVAEEKLDVQLEVIALENWSRKSTYEATGLAWTPPSPNLRTAEQVMLYPMVGLLEGTNLSVGRGTDTPFELLGAPYIDEKALARRLSVKGVSFAPTTFTPRAAPFANQLCHGIRVHITDRDLYKPIEASLAIAQALHGESEWDLSKLNGLLQSKSSLDALESGTTPATITATWSRDIAAFTTRRTAYLLY